MKFNKFFKVVAAIAVMPMFFSCGAPKAVTSDLKEVSVPLSSKEYRSDANFFRATGIGESPDLVTAKKIATLNARTEIASSIQSTIKAVSEQYLNQVTVGNKQEFAAKFEETSRQVVNQVLEGVVVKEEKVFQSKEGKYQYYINVEMSKEPVVKNTVDAISKDEKLALEFDKFQFQKTFDAEMAKLEK
ncbi:MAG: LPP20 family lipoprotein [Bacteroidales bacterium]|nr:LPP20 family lipoprotein [Bacteroidales bacterium]